VKKLVLVYIFNCLSYSAIASTEFTFNPKQKIEAVVAAHELNRIQLNGGEVMEVIGNEDKYSLQWSSDYRNLFVSPKVEVGETIELSLVFAGGEAQDIRFTVGDITAQTIFVNNVAADSRINETLRTEVNRLMKTMMMDVNDKYYVIDDKRLLLKEQETVIRQLKTYRYEKLNLSGVVLQVKNRSRKIIEVQEEKVRKFFKNILAINMKTSFLSPKGECMAFIVIRDSHDE